MSKETKLYLPIKDFFTAFGYEVKSEINNCDVVAYREGENPIIIELKTKLSLDLIFQATRRLEITDRVYIAISDDIKSSRSSRFLIAIPSASSIIAPAGIPDLENIYPGSAIYTPSNLRL